LPIARCNITAKKPGEQDDRRYDEAIKQMKNDPVVKRLREERVFEEEKK
jgi:hypothetical protein